MYAISSFYGSVPWLENANNLPEIIRYLNENMIAAAYIIHQPDEYWVRKRELIMAMHQEWDDAKIEAEMEIQRDKITETIANVMAGRKNAGKFFTCVDFIDPDGNKQEWKIEPIEMNIDKYITAQAEISRIADSSTTSGFGLNPALSNIIIDGKGDYSWDYKKYIRDVLVEYTHMKGHFTKYYSGKFVRIGKPWVSKLECLNSAECLLIWPPNDSRRLEDVTNILNGNFD